MSQITANQSLCLFPTHKGKTGGEVAITENRGFGNSLPAFFTDAEMTREQNNIEVLIGQQIKTARKKKRVTQKSAAKVLGVSFQQFQKYENAQNRLSGADLLRLSVFFGEPIDFFLNDARAVLTNMPVFSSGQQKETYNLREKTIYAYGLIINAITDEKFREGLIQLAKRHTRLCGTTDDECQ